MKIIESEDELQQLIAGSDKAQVFFYKHSPACPISFRAKQEIEAFEKANPGVIVAMIDVLKNRLLSASLAKHSKIKHESPEIILYENQKPVFFTSHSGIRKEALQTHYKRTL